MYYDYKHLKRYLRYKIVKKIIEIIENQPLKNLPKWRKILILLFPIIFRKELYKAYSNLPPEFNDKKDLIIYGVLYNQVMNLLEIFFYEKLLNYYDDYVRFENIEIIKPLLAEKKGFIILSAHYGNWELLSYSLVKIGLSLNVIVRPQAINHMTELMNSYRIKRNVKVIMSNTLKESLEVLKRGEQVGMLSDLDAKEHGYLVPFFGKPASFYSSPVVLSIRAKVPLIPTFIIREKNNTHTVYFKEPITTTKHETIVKLIEKYVKVYEEMIRLRPDLWVWFHERYALAHKAKREI